MNENYHHGIPIREYRQKRGMTQLELAERWPTGPVNLRYVQYIEKGAKQIVDQYLLRQLSDLLDIPLWRFGLSAYNPFAPETLPGHGERMHQETLDVAESLLQQTWRLRQIAPLAEAERSAGHVSNLFDYFLTYLPPPALLEPRFLRLQAQVQRLMGVMQVEREDYDEALQSFTKMSHIAKQLGEPSLLTLALMNIGVELERAGRKQEAVEFLEKARDLSFETSREIAALVHSYLARAYASNGDALRFQRAIDTAQTLLSRLKQSKGHDDNQVFYSLSSVLAELSYGYPEIGEPQKTLDMRKDIAKQIKADNNMRLSAWIPLDWARAYLMLHEIEESAKAGIELLHRAVDTQSPHIMSRAEQHLIKLEEAGYTGIAEVQQFRHELDQARREPEKEQARE
jgi:tetratricopeptide (TPR) repeat protein